MWCRLPASIASSGHPLTPCFVLLLGWYQSCVWAMLIQSRLEAEACGVMAGYAIHPIPARASERHGPGAEPDGQASGPFWAWHGAHGARAAEAGPGRCHACHQHAPQLPLLAAAASHEWDAGRAAGHAWEPQCQRHPHLDRHSRDEPTGHDSQMPEVTICSLALARCSVAAGRATRTVATSWLQSEQQGVVLLCRGRCGQGAWGQQAVRP